MKLDNPESEIRQYPSFKKLILIYHLMKDTGIVSQKVFSLVKILRRWILQLLRTESFAIDSDLGRFGDLVRLHRRRKLILFGISFMLYFCLAALRFFYKQKFDQGEKYEELPKSKWKNSYPIVLVYGLSGGAMDQSLLWG